MTGSFKRIDHWVNAHDLVVTAAAANGVEAMTTDHVPGCDVLVIGSGGAGLLAACRAADTGASVIVAERHPLLGGTTAISGGMLWVPARAGMPSDSADSALRYLLAVTEGTVPPQRLRDYIETSCRMVEYLAEHTPVRLFEIDRPDYHPDWPGGHPGGRCLDNRPFHAGERVGLLDRIRRDSHFPPLTYQESHDSRWLGPDPELLSARLDDDVVTVGAALVAALVAGCDDHGIQFLTGLRARSLRVRSDRVCGVDGDGPNGRVSIEARSAVILASGGFESNASLRKAFLGNLEVTPAGPADNDGDGLLMALRAGAAVDLMSDAWWAPVVTGPARSRPAQPGQRTSWPRHLVGERCLPGSIMVNRTGRRFVNEAINYNDVTKALFQFDPVRHEPSNLPAWLVVDETFRRRYPIGAARADEPPPDWFLRGESLTELAANAGIDAAGLSSTVAEFNSFAALGVDAHFGRGSDVHDRYYGDDRRGSNPCLGPLDSPPFWAVPVGIGTLGTKGGLVTDPDGRVLGTDGAPVDGLFAAGNVAASVMGPGYPGSGGTLGPALAAGYRCGAAAGAGAQRPATVAG